MLAARLAVLGSLLMAPPVLAHGGGPYRGPGDIVPPYPGPSLPSVHGYRDPQPRPAAPVAPIAATARPAPAGATLLDRLSSVDFETRERAVLELATSTRAGALADLCALVLDSKRGRRLVAAAAVGPRTRSVAAYALARLARASDELLVRTRAVVAFDVIARRAGAVDRDLLIAVAHALETIAPAGSSRPIRALRATCALALRSCRAALHPRR